MSGGKSVVTVVLLALSSGACYQGPGDVDVFDEISEMRKIHTNSIKWNDIKWNDIKWNDIKWNGVKWNGIKWNGIKWNGIKWNDIKWNGVTWSKSWLEGSSIVIGQWKNWKWEEHRDEDLIGMEINITVDVTGGNTSTSDFVIRVNDVTVDEHWDDVFYYDLSISLKGSNAWTPLCADADNQPLPAIPLRHYWNETNGNRIDDHDVITFACTNGVLAHCVQWGYRPWAKARRCKDWDTNKNKHCEWVSLRDYHQACTRMARADYCGDGVAWTVPGTPIDIYDHLNPQIEASETDWDIEAEWTPSGAFCLNDIRQQGWKAEGKYPQCNNGKAQFKNDCGSLKKHRALLASNFEPVDE
jgi:hypothetical protein